MSFLRRRDARASSALFALLLATPLIACGGSTESGASHPDASTHQDSGGDLQENGAGGCVETPDFNRPCAPDAVECPPSDTGDPCASTDIAICAAGKWENSSFGNCCEWPDGGHYASTGGCEEFGPDSGDDGDDDGGDDGSADDEAGDGGADDGGADDGGDDAGDGGDDGGSSVASCAACSASELCVTTVHSGGACMPPNDAGVCANGGMAAPGTCCNNETTTYECTSLPSACNGQLTCGCASSLCDGCMCSVPAGNPNELSCSCLAP